MANIFIEVKKTIPTYQKIYYYNNSSTNFNSFRNSIIALL